ncbi:MAG: hypothetical protein IT322_20445 [Anaerolineae bacterium]|nr:hypothetical protein [Anaerolineae bacterium]
MIAQQIKERYQQQPFFVAVDGIDAAGKTMLAEALAQILRLEGFDVIRASLDGFHNPKEIRARRGSLSPEGYYEDSFNYEALQKLLLDPLRTGRSSQYQVKLFDFRTDSETSVQVQTALSHEILVFEGVFLQRPELVNYWDMVIFVDIPFETALERAATRDLPLFGTLEVLQERYLSRYIPGQKLYFERCAPKENADIVIDNRVPENPEILKCLIKKRNRS